MKNMLVIGLGRFGQQLAKSFMELGCDVMAVDSDEKIVNSISWPITRLQIGDCTDELVLKQIGVSDFDCCFVCMGQHFQTALEISSLLKENGAKRVIAKTDNARHAKLLLKIGADEIVFPERDMAKRTAVKFNAGNIFEYFELTPEYSVFEIKTPTAWLGKTVIALNIRAKYGINIIAAKKKGRFVPITSGDFTFTADEHLLVAGEKESIIRISGRG